MGAWKKIPHNSLPISGSEIPQGVLTGANLEDNWRTTGRVVTTGGLAIGGLQIIDSGGRWVSPDTSGLKGAKGESGDALVELRYNALPLVPLETLESTLTAPGCAAYVPEYKRMVLNTGAGLVSYPEPPPIEFTLESGSPRFLRVGDLLSLSIRTNYPGMRCIATVNGFNADITSAGDLHNARHPVHPQEPSGAPRVSITVSDSIGRVETKSMEIKNVRVSVDNPPQVTGRAINLSRSGASVVFPGETIKVILESSAEACWGDTAVTIGGETGHTVFVSPTRFEATAVVPIAAEEAPVQWVVSGMKTTGLRPLSLSETGQSIYISRTGSYVPGSGGRPEVKMEFLFPDRVRARFSRIVAGLSVESLRLSGDGVGVVSLDGEEFVVRGRGACEAIIPEDAVRDAGGNGNSEGRVSIYLGDSSTPQGRPPLDMGPLKFLDGNSFQRISGHVSLWARESPIPTSASKVLVWDASGTVLKSVGDTRYEYFGTPTREGPDGHFRHHCLSEGKYWLDGELVAEGALLDAPVLGNGPDPLESLYGGFRGDLYGPHEHAGPIHGPQAYKRGLRRIPSVRSKRPVAVAATGIVLVRAEIEGPIKIMDAGELSVAYDGSAIEAVLGETASRMRVSPGLRDLAFDFSTSGKFGMRCDGGPFYAIDSLDASTAYFREGLAKSAMETWTTFTEGMYAGFRGLAPRSETSGLTSFMDNRGHMRAVRDFRDAKEAYGTDRIVANYTGPLFRSGDVYVYGDPLTGLAGAAEETGPPTELYDQIGGSRTCRMDLFRENSRIEFLTNGALVGSKSYDSPCVIVTGKRCLYVTSPDTLDLNGSDTVHIRDVNSDIVVAIYPR